MELTEPTGGRQLCKSETTSEAELRPTVWLRFVGLLAFGSLMTWSICKERTGQLAILTTGLLLWQLALALEIRHLRGLRKGGNPDHRLEPLLQQVLELVQRDRNEALRLRLDQLTEAERLKLTAKVLKAVRDGLGDDSVQAARPSDAEAVQRAGSRGPSTPIERRELEEQRGSIATPSSGTSGGPDARDEIPSPGADSQTDDAGSKV